MQTASVQRTQKLRSSAFCELPRQFPLPELQDAGDVLPVGAQFADVIEVADVEASVASARQRHRRHQLAVLRFAVAAAAVELPLLAVAHDCDHFARLLLEVDVGAVALVQDALLEVVRVVDVQVPASDLGRRDVVAAHRRRLSFPEDLVAVLVLVPNSDCNHNVQGREEHGEFSDCQSV